MEIHNRLIKTKSINISDIQFPENFRNDDYLIGLIKKNYSGLIKSGLTRININEIHSGFFVSNGNLNESVTNLNIKHIPSYMGMIRAGYRPPLMLYWSSLSPSGGQYVCPDDEVALAAYRALGFKFVPCSILKPVSAQREDGVIIVKNSNEIVSYDGIISSSRERACLRLGAENYNLNLTVRVLTKECEKLCKYIKDFNLDSDYGIHYNQMMHSFLIRHCRGMDSIKRLINLKRLEHAEVVIRMLYEAFLNLYMDWLSPQFIGPSLHLFSMIRADSVGLSGKKCKVEYQDAFNKVSSFESLFEKTVEKARISPLGMIFYERLYSVWSLTAHQAYTNIASESTGFDEKIHSVTQISLSNICRCLDVLTGEILRIIANDVGKYQEFMPNTVDA